jgi:hypothetical protein
VPSTIPAGDSPVAPVAQAAVVDETTPGGLLWYVGVLVAAALLVVRVVARRRPLGRHLRR